MRLWPFRRKNPSSLTLNKNFYLSILSGAELPPLLQVVNPDGSNGAVEGFGAPLHTGGDRDILNRPVQSGSYVVTTRDKLTVAQMDVFAISDVPQYTKPATPNPEANLVGEAFMRAAGAAFLTNFVFKGYDLAVYPSVRFFLDLVARFAELAAGVVGDAPAETYRLPEQLQNAPAMDPRIDFRDLGAIRIAELSDGYWVSTRGLAKFNQPEFEMFGLHPAHRDPAAEMLIAAGQQALLGMPIGIGETAFSPASPLAAVAGERERAQWGDRPTIEFRDPGSTSAKLGVDAWTRG
jgi:hypothetical protein